MLYGIRIRTKDSLNIAFLLTISHIMFNFVEVNAKKQNANIKFYLMLAKRHFLEKR